MSIPDIISDLMSWMRLQRNIISVSRFFLFHILLTAGLDRKDRADDHHDLQIADHIVAELVNYYKMDPEEEMIVIYDDISLAPGNLRIRKKGSAGGHNGIKNIIAMTGTQNFLRIKVGVGEKPAGWDLADHVLGHFDAADRVEVEKAIGHAVEAAEMMITGETDAAMNRYNVKKKEE